MKAETKKELKADISLIQGLRNDIPEEINELIVASVIKLQQGIELTSAGSLIELGVLITLSKKYN